MQLIHLHRINRKSSALIQILRIRRCVLYTTTVLFFLKLDLKKSAMQHKILNPCIMIYIDIYKYTFINLEPGQESPQIQLMNVAYTRFDHLSDFALHVMKMYLK